MMRRKPRVFQVLTNLDIGGAQSSVTALACGLRRRGWDVQVVYSSEGGRDPMKHRLLQDRLAEAKVPVHDIGHMRRSVHPMEDWAAVRAMRRLFRDEEPDIVHTHMSKAGILGRWAAVAAKVPVVAHTVRGWSFYSGSNAATRRLYVELERYFAQRTQGMFVVSPRMIDDGVAEGIGKREDYTVARTGIDVAKFSAIRERRRGGDEQLAEVRRRCEIPEDALVIGGAMNLTPQKAPLEFVDACLPVLEAIPTAHVLLVGNGELRRQVDARITASGMAERFHLVGLQADVTPYLAIFDVLLLASHWEGLPRITLECVVAGVPIVATRVGGTVELESWAPHPESPIALRDPGDVQGLAEAVTRALQNIRRSESRPDRRSELRSTVEAESPLPREFHLENVLDVHEEVYGRLLADRRLAAT